MLNTNILLDESNTLEAILRQALNEKSIQSASPMTDAEITALLGKVATLPNSTTSHFARTIKEMGELILHPTKRNMKAEHIFWARKILRRFQEIMFFLDTSDIVPGTILH
jgi:hypothetical protein